MYDINLNLAGKNKFIDITHFYSLSLIYQTLCIYSTNNRELYICTYKQTLSHLNRKQQKIKRSRKTQG